MLSIVIVSSDNTDITLACLKSVYQNPPSMPFEVILVDNHSTISCLPLVNDQFPKVITIYSPIRQGFSMNYNIGIRLSRGDYVAIINNDTLIHPRAFNLLVESIHKFDCGMAGPKLLSVDGRIQTDCVRSFPTPWSYIRRVIWLDPGFPSGRWWQARLRRRIAKMESGQVEAISGSCMLVSRKALERVGLLDEGYDFYYEDIEWCHRFRNHGLKIAYIAESCVTHLHDQSLSKIKEWAKQSEYRSALRYFKQYHHLSQLGEWRLWLVTIIGFYFRAVLFSLSELITRKISHAQSYRNLTRWILRHPPGKDNEG